MELYNTPKNQNWNHNESTDLHLALRRKAGDGSPSNIWRPAGDSRRICRVC